MGGVTTQLIISSAVTLLAVWLGAGLSLMAQTRAMTREGSHHWRSARIACYSRFLGAVRAYVTHLRAPGPAEAVAAYVERAEVALAEVQLLARHAGTVDRAVALLAAAHDLAAEPGPDGGPGGPAEPAGRPADALFRAEQEFLTAAGGELRAGDRPPAAR
jgi:hypothetical protein